MTPPALPPDEGLNGAVAAEIRAERAAQNMTVQQLAIASDVAYPSLRRYLAGERHIDMAVLEAVASALGLDPFELVRRAGDRRGRIDAIWNTDEKVVVMELKGGVAKPDPSSFEGSDIAADDQDNEKARLD